MALPSFVQRAAKKIAAIPIAGPLLRTIAGGKLLLMYRVHQRFRG
jgi:hypothetical protein